MTFKLERLNIITTNYDKTMLMTYTDTVGAGADKDGNSLSEITAADFFNSLTDEKKTPINLVTGSIIIVSATDGFAVAQVKVADDNKVTLLTS